jgi:hypothetical protein
MREIKIRLYKDKKRVDDINLENLVYWDRIDFDFIVLFTGFCNFCEGDIIRVLYHIEKGYKPPNEEPILEKCEDVLEVVWLDGGFLVRGNSIYDYAPLSTIIEEAEDIEIIGNIHEN